MSAVKTSPKSAAKSLASHRLVERSQRTSNGEDVLLLIRDFERVGNEE